MKKFQLIFVFCLSLLFTSCLDTVENLTINDKGSGTLQMNMDMSRGMEMMKGFLASDSNAQSNLSKKIDTTIQMRSMVDTAKNMPAEAKALYKDASMHIRMNADSNLMKFDMNFPFKSQQDLAKLYASMQKDGMGMNSMMQSAAGAQGDQAPPDSPVEPGSPGQFTNIFDVTVKDGEYKRVVNKERYEKMKADPKMEQLKGMSAMMGEMNYTFNLSLPRPVKSVSNSNAVISSDKKHVMLKSELFAMLDNPSVFEITVQY